MKKAIMLLLTVVVLMLIPGIIFAGGKAEQEVQIAPEVTAPKKVITIKMGNVDSPFHLTMSESNGEYASTDIKCRAFKKILETTSQGRFKVEIFPAGQLGGEREMLEMCAEGSLQMTGCSASPVASLAPEMMAFQIPYFFKDVNVATRVMDGPLGDEFNELILEKTGIRYLAWGFEGYFNIGTTKKPIAVPSDLKGMKIRSSVTPNFQEIFKLTGGVATPIPFQEIYTAVQQGVVEGACTTIGLHYTIKLQELEKYFNMADIFYGWSPICINEEFYRSLPAEDQYLIKEAAIKARNIHLAMVLWGRDLWVEHFKGLGIKFIFPTTEQKAEWVKCLKNPMEAWTRKEIGDEWVDKVIAASKKAEEELYGDIF